MCIDFRQFWIVQKITDSAGVFFFFLNLIFNIFFFFFCECNWRQLCREQQPLVDNSPPLCSCTLKAKGQRRIRRKLKVKLDSWLKGQFIPSHVSLPPVGGWLFNQSYKGLVKPEPWSTRPSQRLPSNQVWALTSIVVWLMQAARLKCLPLSRRTSDSSCRFPVSAWHPWTRFFPTVTLQICWWISSRCRLQAKQRCIWKVFVSWVKLHILKSHFLGSKHKLSNVKPYRFQPGFQRPQCKIIRHRQNVRPCSSSEGKKHKMKPSSMCCKQLSPFMGHLVHRFSPLFLKPPQVVAGDLRNSKQKPKLGNLGNMLVSVWMGKAFRTPALRRLCWAGLGGRVLGVLSRLSRKLIHRAFDLPGDWSKFKRPRYIFQQDSAEWTWRPPDRHNPCTWQFNTRKKTDCHVMWSLSWSGVFCDIDVKCRVSCSPFGVSNHSELMGKELVKWPTLLHHSFLSWKSGGYPLKETSI